MIQCPHCHTSVDAPYALAGGVVQCDNCGGRFQMPAMIEHEPILPPQAAPPQIIVVSHSTAPRYRPPMKPHGWFARAFATTAGVLAAIIAFNVALLVLLVFAFVLFREYARSQNHPKTSPPAATRR